jgi:hypothetical protein
MKKQKGKVKSINVSVSAQGVDPSVLQELGDAIADAQGGADEAQNAALESVSPVVTAGVSVSESVESLSPLNPF